MTPLVRLGRLMSTAPLRGVREADGFWARLVMRLGRHHVAADDYKAAVDGLRVMQQRLQDGLFFDKTQTSKEISKIGGHMNSFRDTCFELVGTELD